MIGGGPGRILASLVLSAVTASAAEPPAIDLRQVAHEVDQVERGVQAAADQMDLVQHGYVDRIDSGTAESLEKRYGKAELYFLLQDYVAASVLLLDVVLTPEFRASRHYVDGLYYLGEALYRQKDYLGAKQYLRQVIDAGPSHFRFEDALGRYLDIAARTNDYRDLDRYAEVFKGNGRSAPAIQYLLGKAAYGRHDLPTSERLSRAIALFEGIAPGPHYLQARYFIGACQVEAGNLAGALKEFTTVARSRASDSSDAAVRELAWLAMGRIDYQLGRYDAALDAYQQIPESSSSFYDALYEIAWTYVKKRDYEDAGKAVDLILLGAPATKLTPRANLLKGHLLLRLKKFGEAEESYNSVINKYGPVRDEIDALLEVHADPAAYFEQLLTEKGKTFDVATLLPPAARQWADSQRDVAEAQEVVSDLQQSQAGITTAQEIVDHVKRRLAAAGTMEAFPALQEGYARASAVDNALLAYDRQAVGIEQDVVAAGLSPAQRKALLAARAERAALQPRFDALPKSEADVDSRRAVLVHHLSELGRELFRLSLVVQSERAQIVAIRQAEEAGVRQSAAPADQARFASRVDAELAGLDDLDRQIDSLRRTVKDGETLAAGAGSSEDAELRRQYAEAVDREADLLAQARAATGGEALDLAGRLETQRHRIESLRRRAADAMETFRRAALAKAAVIREKIALENRNLDDYSREVAAAQGAAGGLVGRMAFASFEKVRRSFHDLVLKADVGIIDVAWTRKLTETTKIQKLASQKDHELGVLDDDFREVLGEVK